MEPLTITINSNGKVNLEVVQELIAAVEAVEYGAVEVTIHQGRVVQIERRERVRLKLDADSCGRRL